MRGFGLQGADKDQRLAARRRFVPNDADMIWTHENGSAVYIHDVNGVLYGTAFTGTAGNPTWNYRFRTAENRAKTIDDFIASVAHHVDLVAARRAEKASWANPLKPGDILYTSWGYDQTNVEFYAVTRVSGKRVWIREIAATYTETGFMSGRTKPVLPIEYIGPESMHVARGSGNGGAAVKINESATAWLETTPGREHGTSSYA